MAVCNECNECNDGYSENNNSFGKSVKKNLKKYLFGLVAGLISFFLLIFLFAALLTIGSIPDSLAGLFSYTAVAVSAFVAGFVAVRLIGTGGLKNGVIMGVMMLVVHLALSMVCGNHGVSLAALILLVLDPLCAVLGGITAVNTKS